MNNFDGFKAVDMHNNDEIDSKLLDADFSTVVVAVPMQSS